MSDVLSSRDAFPGDFRARRRRPSWPASVCLTGLLTILTVACGGGGGAAAADTPTNPEAPQIVGPPVSQSVAVGGTATFSVEVTSPDAPTYQWTRNSVNIPDATEKSYTTPPVKSEDNGATFQVVVTNAKGSNTSKPVTLTVKQPSTGAVIVNHFNTDLSKIPASWINAAKNSRKIYYRHTSHGTQLVSGMDALAKDPLYAFTRRGSGVAWLLDDSQDDGDLGNPDFTTWEKHTRNYLNNSANVGTNVVIWSWCGQVSSASEAVITAYLELMTQLEKDFPSVKFVYMTGHLDGKGTAGNLNQRNNQIRDYCQANDKILFDFADIESYEPNGTRNLMVMLANDQCDYDSDGNGSRDKNWASDWIAAHPSDPLTTLAKACGSCAHSERLNCIMKGRAAWWLWARLAGWNGQ